MRFVVNALKHNNLPIPNSGVFTAYSFASPANHAVTCSYGNFLTLVKTPEFSPLLHDLPSEFGQIVVHGDSAEQIVTVRGKSGNTAFKFRLRRQSEGNCRECWMVDGVEKFPRAKKVDPR